VRRNNYGHDTAQRYQHQRFTSSTGVNQIGCTYALQPEFLVHSVLDLIDIQDQDVPNYRVLSDSHSKNKNKL